MTTAQAKTYTTKLLQHYPFVDCDVLEAKTTNHTPHRGDVVLFNYSGRFTHTGYVYAVDCNYFYTIEGNTSGASGVIANGGGVCKKSYRTASYSASKFYRPDYSMLVSAGFFGSVDAAISAIIATASAEVGYLEKNNASNLDSKTAGAGSGNYTKYWRDIYPAFQAQPWCACFVTWIIQKTLEACGSGSGTSADASATSGSSSCTTFGAVKPKLNAYIGQIMWCNGSTPETVYCDSAGNTEIGELDPYDSAAAIGKVNGMYALAYKVDGADDYKVGFVEYFGNASVSKNSAKSYKNGSCETIVYANTKCSKKVGSLNAYESLNSLGTLGGRTIVLYQVDGADYYKIGIVK